VVRFVAACGLVSGCDKVFFLDEPPSDASQQPPTDTGIDVPRNTVLQVVAGGRTSCVRLASGEVWCWGAGGNGEIGDGLDQDSPIPKQVATAVAAVQIDGGDAGECLLDAEGEVLCWGGNGHGALGIGSFNPAIVPMGTGITDGAEVSVGNTLACVRRTSGKVACAGAAGQLGDGTQADRPTFGDVIGITDAIAITVGDSFACALRETGAVSCWGLNGFGQLGDGTNADSPFPVAGPAGPYTTLAALDEALCAVRIAGGVDCWGNNDPGQLGDGMGGAGVTRATAAPVLTITDATAVAGISVTACALHADHTVQCWGDGLVGELGNGIVANTQQPGIPVSGLVDAIAISARTGGHACALTATHVVECWGSNDRAQLGIGSGLPYSTTPRMVLNLP
jgi:alpha-tubulin suppressor-like RCC1 family protein